MATFIGQPQLRLPANTTPDLAGLGTAVRGAIDERTRRADLASAAGILQSGGSIEDAASELAGSRDATLATLGLKALQEARTTKATQAESARRFDVTTGLKRQELGLKTAETAATINKLNAEAQQLANAGGFKDQGEKAKFTSNLRKEVAKRSDAFIKIRDSYGRVKATSPNAAGDLALIFNYMKMLDPNSVVRESEYATVGNAQGVPARIRNLYNQLIAGAQIDQTTRDDIFALAGKLYEGQQTLQQRVTDQFFSIAERVGLDPANILLDLGPALTDTAALPEGVTEDDIEFTMEKHGLTRAEVLERLR